MRRFEPNEQVRTGPTEYYHQYRLALVQEPSKSPSSCWDVIVGRATRLHPQVLEGAKKKKIEERG